MARLVEQVLKLPEERRGDLGCRLLDILDPPTKEECEAAWIAEVERRIEDSRAGKVKWIPGDVVLRRVRRLLERRRRARAETPAERFVRIVIACERSKREEQRALARALLRSLEPGPRHPKREPKIRWIAEGERRLGRSLALAATRRRRRTGPGPGAGHRSPGEGDREG